MVPNQFEMPYDLRMLAESNVRQSSAACKQILDTTAQVMTLWLNALPQNEMTSRLKAINQQIIGFGRQSVDAAFAFAGELITATNFQDVLAKQSRYAQTQIHNYDRQTQELGRLVLGTAN